MSDATLEPGPQTVTRTIRSLERATRQVVLALAAFMLIGAASPAIAGAQQSPQGHGVCRNDFNNCLTDEFTSCTDFVDCFGAAFEAAMFVVALAALIALVAAFAFPAAAAFEWSPLVLAADADAAAATAAASANAAAAAAVANPMSAVAAVDAVEASEAATAAAGAADAAWGGALAAQADAAAAEAAAAAQLAGVAAEAAPMSAAAAVAAAEASGAAATAAGAADAAWAGAAAGDASGALAASAGADAASAAASEAAEAGIADVADNASLRTVLAGHGDWAVGDGYVTVPQGTYVTMFVPDATLLDNSAGLVIDQGLLPEGQGFVQTFGPGDVLPNYTLSPPTGLGIQNPILIQPGAGLQVGATNVVNAPTTLSQLLAQNQGEVWWSACRALAGAL